MYMYVGSGPPADGVGRAVSAPAGAARPAGRPPQGPLYQDLLPATCPKRVGSPPAMPPLALPPLASPVLGARPSPEPGAVSGTRSPLAASSSQWAARQSSRCSSQQGGTMGAPIWLGSLCPESLGEQEGPPLLGILDSVHPSMRADRQAQQIAQVLYYVLV